MQYAPKRIAICSKTPCNMQQNTLRLAAKRKVFCCETQGKMVQNANLNAAFRE